MQQIKTKISQCTNDIFIIKFICVIPFLFTNVSFKVEIKGINCLQTQVMQKPQSANQAPVFRFTVSTLNGNEYVVFAIEEKKKL